MRVLVTGNNGYIGTVLTPMLQARGHEVRGIDSNLFIESRITDVLPNVPTLEKDIRDVQSGDLGGFDALIHLAGLSNDPLGDYHPDLTYDINFRAAERLAQLAKAAGIERFLFASSCSNYGAAGEHFLDEQASFNPVTPYGESKVLVERVLAGMADDGFSPVSLRASTAYGYSPLMRFDLVVNNLVAWASTTGDVYLKSDGTPWRPLVHVEDIARAYIAALEAPRLSIHAQAFNVGSTTENYQIRDIAEMICREVPDSHIAFAPDAGPDTRCYRVDCNKIAVMLHDFKPQWTVWRGIRELYALFQGMELQPSDFEGPRFKRIDHVRQLVADGRLGEDFRWTGAAMQEMSISRVV